MPHFGRERAPRDDVAAPRAGLLGRGLAQVFGLRLAVIGPLETAGVGRLDIAHNHQQHSAPAIDAPRPLQFAPGTATPGTRQPSRTT